MGLGGNEMKRLPVMTIRRSFGTSKIHTWEDASKYILNCHYLNKDQKAVILACLIDHRLFTAGEMMSTDSEEVIFHDTHI